MPNSKLNFYRINLIIGGAIISIFWFIHLSLEGTIDPLIIRILFTVLSFTLLALSYMVPFIKNNLGIFFFSFIYLAVVWLSYLVYVNNFHPVYVVIQFVGFLIFSSYFETKIQFLIFSFFILLVSVLVLTLVKTPVIDNLLYLSLLPVGLAINFMNLSIKTKIQRDLEHKNDELHKFMLIVQNAGEHIIITDPDGKIIYANKAAETTTGYSLTEMIGKRPSLWGGQMPKEFYEGMWDTIKNKKQRFKGEIINRRKGGQIYTALTDIAPVLGENGDIQFFVGIERDVTKEKEAQKAVEERAKELSKMNELMIGRELKMVELKREIAQLKDMASGLAKLS